MIKGEIFSLSLSLSLTLSIFLSLSLLLSFSLSLLLSSSLSLLLSLSLLFYITNFLSDVFVLVHNIKYDLKGQISPLWCRVILKISDLLIKLQPWLTFLWTTFVLVYIINALKCILRKADTVDPSLRWVTTDPGLRWTAQVLYQHPMKIIQK